MQREQSRCPRHDEDNDEFEANNLVPGSRNAIDMETEGHQVIKILGRDTDDKRTYMGSCSVTTKLRKWEA